MALGGMQRSRSAYNSCGSRVSGKTGCWSRTPLGRRTAIGAVVFVMATALALCVRLVVDDALAGFVQPQCTEWFSRAARASLRTNHVQKALSEKDTLKIDRTPDELFYLLPRVGVYHVDDKFRAQLTQLYRLLIPAGGDVLDLCSQHDSHLPSEVGYNSLTVHGMNYVELLANGRATERFTRNFNGDPSLGNLADESMDAVLMTVSIQYMERPVELFKEVRRVLRPGGVFIVSFSNRMFFTKAVEVWKSQNSMRGLVALVQSYFSEAGFSRIRAATAVKLPEQDKSEDSWFGIKVPEPPTGWLPADPFAAVVGYRSELSDTETKEEEEEQLGIDGVSWLPLLGAGSIW